MYILPSNMKNRKEIILHVTGIEFRYISGNQHVNPSVAKRIGFSTLLIKEQSF